MQIHLNDNDSFEGLDRAAKIIALVLRMLVGLGLAVALVLKTYMLVLTEQSCAPDGASLGNLLRCAPVLDLVAGSILLVTGIGFAAALISSGRIQLQETLAMTLVGVLIAFVADITVADSTWQTALVLLALAFPLVVLILLRMRFSELRSETPNSMQQE